MDEPEAVRAVTKYARQYERDFYCRAVLWDAVAAAGHDVAGVLGRVPAEQQGVLRAAYHDFPPSLRGGGRDSQVRVAIEQWCRGEPAEPGAAADPVRSDAPETRTSHGLPGC
jgi:hypothetical protein